MQSLSIVYARVLWYRMLPVEPDTTHPPVVWRPDEDESRVCQQALASEAPCVVVPVALYPYIHEVYRPLTVGAIVGVGVGAWWVSTDIRGTQDAEGRIYGFLHRWSTAYLAAQMYLGRFWPVFRPLAQLIEAVQSGNIHGMVFDQPYPARIACHALQPVLSLGRRWQKETELPYPMYLVVARRDMEQTQLQALREAIAGAVQNLMDLHHTRSNDLQHAFPGLDTAALEQDLRSTLTPYAVDLGETGKRAVTSFLSVAFEQGLVPECPITDWA